MHGTDGRETGCADEVEGQESESRRRGQDGLQDLLESLSGLSRLDSEQGSEGSDDVLLGDESGDGSDGELPVGSPSEGLEYHADGTTDRCQNGSLGVVSEELQMCVVACEEPDQHGCQQDDGSGLLDEGPSPVQCSLGDVEPAGYVVRGQLHDEG